MHSSKTVREGLPQHSDLFTGMDRAAREWQLSGCRIVAVGCRRHLWEELLVNGKVLLRWLALCAIADGLLLLIGERGYARSWQAGAGLVRRLADRFAALPSWALRLTGVAEMGLALALLRRVPIHVGELYHAVAGVYDPASFLWRRWLYAGAHRALDEALAEYLPPDGRVLDLGCGTGANLERLLSLGLPFASYVGVDQSEEMLARARERFAHVDRASFQRLDLAVDPLPQGPFDLAVSTWVLSHLPDPMSMVGMAMGVLGEEGHVVLLFLAESESWQASLLRPLLETLSARPVPEESYLAFPGHFLLRRFAGGSAALMVLKKGA